MKEVAMDNLETAAKLDPGVSEENEAEPEVRDSPGLKVTLVSLDPQDL